MDGGNKLWLRVRMALHHDDVAYQAFQGLYDTCCDPKKGRTWWLHDQVEDMLGKMSHIPLVDANPDVSPSNFLDDQDDMQRSGPTGPKGGYMTDFPQPHDEVEGASSPAPPPLIKCVASKTLRRLAFGIPSQDSYPITTTFPGQMVCKVDPKGEYLIYEVFEAQPLLEAHFEWPMSKGDAVETAQNFDTTPDGDPEDIDPESVFFHEETDRLAFFFMGAFGHFRESRVMRARVDLQSIKKISLLESQVDYIPGDRVLFLEPPSNEWRKGTVISVDGMFMNVMTEVLDTAPTAKPAEKPAAPTPAPAAASDANDAPEKPASAAAAVGEKPAADAEASTAPAAAAEEGGDAKADGVAADADAAGGYDADAPAEPAAKKPMKAPTKKKTKDRKAMRNVTTMRQLVKPEVEEHMGMLVLELDEPVESFAARSVWSRQKEYNDFHILGDWTPYTAASESLRHYITGGVGELKRLTQELIARSDKLRDKFFEPRRAPPPSAKQLMPDESPLVPLRPPGMRRNPDFGPIAGIDEEVGGAAPQVTAGMATELAELLIMEQERQEQEAREEEEREMKRMLGQEEDPNFHFPKHFGVKDNVIDRADAWARGEAVPAKRAEEPAPAAAPQPAAAIEEIDDDTPAPAVSTTRAPPPAKLCPPGRNGKTSWHCGKCKKDGLLGAWVKRCPACGVALAPDTVPLARPADVAAKAAPGKHVDPADVPDTWEDEA